MDFISLHPPFYFIFFFYRTATSYRKSFANTAVLTQRCTCKLFLTNSQAWSIDPWWPIQCLRYKSFQPLVCTAVILLHQRKHPKKFYMQRVKILIYLYLLKFFYFKLKLLSKYCITVWEGFEGKVVLGNYKPADCADSCCY